MVTNRTQSERLNVLMLSPAPDVPGGVSAFAAVLTTHLQACYVTPFWVGSPAGGRECAAATLWRLATAPFIVARQVRSRAIDIVHLNPSLDGKSLLRDGLIVLGLRMSGCRKVLVYFHGWQEETLAAICRRPVLRRLFAWLLNGTGRILVLAPQFRTTLEDAGVRVERILVGRTFFDGAALRAIPETPASARRSILYLSRFVREKGVHELLEAFARIHNDFTDADLVLAGDGEEMQTLRARVTALGMEGRVQFTGYVHGREKYMLLAACTVFALPTYFPEGMPIALLEAMAAGKPLLTANAGGIGAVIREPENGIVLEQVDVESVAAALRRLLADPEYCRRTGERNRVTAWRQFEAGVVAGEIEALYRSVAAS